MNSSSMNRRHSLKIFNFCRVERRQKRLINTLAIMCNSMLFLDQFLFFLYLYTCQEITFYEIINNYIEFYWSKDKTQSWEYLSIQKLMLFLLCFPTFTQLWPLNDLTFFSFVFFLILEPSFKKLRRVSLLVFASVIQCHCLAYMRSLAATGFSLRERLLKENGYERWMGLCAVLRC